MANNKEFKEGLKATSLFGSVKIFSILISMIRSKFVAVLLGPEGMGLNSMLQSSQQMFNAFTGLGLGTSAVKDIAEAYASNNLDRVSRIISVFRKLVILTGSLGFILFLLLSPVLSWISFGSYDYIYAFAAISVTLLFLQLSEGQRALLQGTRHFGYMAKSAILGSIIGTIVIIPLYYLLGMQGVVPGIILSALIGLCLSWYYARKVPYKSVKVSLKETFIEGRGMLNMGFFLSLQTLISYIIAYLVRIFINHYGGLSDVGLFGAGFSLVEMYVGMVFTAMSSEYYPRLASHSKDSDEIFCSTINQQIEISLILISPLICLFLIFGEWAVLLLYSEKFLPITMMINLAMLGTMFKAPSWSIAMSFMAKGDSKLYFLNELSAMLINTPIRLLFYYFGGLTGIGVAFLLTYILYFIQVFFLCRFKYHFKFDMSVLKPFMPQFAFAICCFCLFAFVGGVVQFVAGAFIVIISASISYKGISKHINVRQIINKKIVHK